MSSNVKFLQHTPYPFGENFLTLCDNVLEYDVCVSEKSQPSLSSRIKKLLKYSDFFCGKLNQYIETFCSFLFRLKIKIDEDRITLAVKDRSMGNWFQRDWKIFLVGE